MKDGLVTTARVENGWELLAIAELHPGGDGYLPNGVVLVRRSIYPLPYREYAVAGYYEGELETTFGSGDYDLTLEEARAVFARRARLEGAKDG